MPDSLASVIHLRDCRITLYQSTRHYRLVGGPSCIGGTLPLVYLLPLRPIDPEDPDRALKLPRDLARTFGAPVPRAAFGGGRLPAPVRIWQVLTADKSGRRG